MNPGPAIYNLLINNSTVATKVGTRVFPAFVPQDTQFPAVVYAFSSQEPNNTKDGVSTLDVLALDIQVYHEDYNEAQAIAEAIRSELDYFSGTQDGVVFDRIFFSNQSNNSFESMYEFIVLSQSYNVRIRR